MSKLNRRTIAKHLLLGLCAAPVALVSRFAFGAEPKKGSSGKMPASTAKKPAGLPLVDPGKDPVAKALQYVHDAKSAKRVDKAGVKADKQFCDNCALYVAGTGGLGKCTMIQSGQVKGKGWCMSWQAKG